MPCCVLSVHGPRPPGTEGAAEGGGGFPMVENLLRFHTSEAVAPVSAILDHWDARGSSCPACRNGVPPRATRAATCLCHPRGGGRMQDPAQRGDGVTTGCCSSVRALFSSCWQPVCPRQGRCQLCLAMGPGHPLVCDKYCPAAQILMGLSCYPTATPPLSAADPLPFSPEGIRDLSELCANQPTARCGSRWDGPAGRHGDSGGRERAGRSAAGRAPPGPLTW